jgi:D-hydroxyproline dehydrogenase subunit beta
LSRPPRIAPVNEVSNSGSRRTAASKLVVDALWMRRSIGGLVQQFDLAVVGGGIVGLAHALAAARRKLRVVVIERDARANGASIRNFGFVTVTGQQAGATWRRARRSRDIWLDIAPKAKIRIEHKGLAVAARRPEAAEVLSSFCKTEMGEGCTLLGEREARERFPFLVGPVNAALWSPHELRVESSAAIPLLKSYLVRQLGVEMRGSTTALRIEPPDLVTSRGIVRAGAVVVCTGDELNALYADRIANYGLTRCKLQMLRVRSGTDETRLPCAVMSDLSLVRYLGYAELGESAALRRRLEAEQPQHLVNGIHLIAVGSVDGTRVVGDSHHYHAAPDPFASDFVDELILAEYAAVFGSRPDVVARSTGTYASAADRPMLCDAPEDRVRLVLVTSGTGASTAFAIAEETIEELFP